METSTDTTGRAVPGALGLQLEEVNAANHEVGSKAMRLGELIRAGFDVPAGIAIPAGTVDRICSPGNEEDLSAVVDRVVAALGEGPLAVRSSAVAEDLPGASFAGQYETVLNVHGSAAIAGAIRRCRASAESEHAIAYLERRDEGTDARMGVLIQEMVPADAAGVAFSADPVTGERGRVLVSAVRGLGERLVSGAASPDEWAVENGEATVRAAHESAIDARQVLEVAELARRVEVHFGVPQDVEWAIADGRLYLLQARPITTLGEPGLEPLPVPVEAPEGYWERESTHYPQPLSPMQRSTMLPFFDQSWRKIFAEVGALLEGIELQEIGGWVYMRLVPFGGKEGKPPPPIVFKLLTRIVPSLRKRIRACVQAMRRGLVWQWLDEWEREGRAATISTNEELRAVDLASLSDSELRRHLERVHAHMWRVGEIHFRLHAPYSLGTGELILGCRDLLGWDDYQSLRLVNGLSEMSSTPARRLAEVAALAAGRPEALAVLRQPRATLEDLRAADPEVAAAVQGYLGEFGCRLIRYEVADLTLEESEDLVLRLVADQVATAYDPRAHAEELAARRREAEEEARAALAGRPADLARFEVLLERGRRAYPLREDQEFHTISVPGALLRYALLETGRRMVVAGQIEAPDDVMWLEWDELLTALDAGTACQETVERRKRERAWVLAHPGPESYGPEPPPPPSFDIFPPEVRHLHEILFWAVERSFAPPVTEHEADLLRGVPAAAGTYTGPVRIVMDESEFHRVQPGDVLVCPITAPVWSVVFPSIGALVTESGGVLSHPAIIAREYRLPAVVAVGGATTLLQDGEMVTVDGAAGEVQRLGG